MSWLLDSLNISEANQFEKTGNPKHLGAIIRNNILIGQEAERKARAAALNAEQAAGRAEFKESLRRQAEANAETPAEAAMREELEALQAAVEATEQADAYRHKPVSERTVDQLDLRGPRAAEDFFNSF